MRGYDHICEECSRSMFAHDEECDCGGRHDPPLCCPGCPCNSYHDAHAAEAKRLRGESDAT